MHHVNKLALTPDKYAYLPPKVMKLVEETHAYKQIRGQEIDGAASNPEFLALAKMQDDEEPNVDVAEEGGERNDSEEGEEEQPEEDPEVDEEGWVPDFEDKDGCKHLRDAGVLDELSDSSVEITGFKPPRVKIDKSPMPIQTEDTIKRSSKRRAVEDDDSSNDAKAAPPAPGRRGGQKVQEKGKKPKLMHPKPKVKAASGDEVLYSRASESSDSDPALKSPFVLGERKPQSNRPGEWYILQAAGGAGARYTVTTSRERISTTNIVHGV